MAESSESWRLVDLRCRLNDAEELRRLVQALAYPPEIAEARFREILQSYRQHPEWPFVAVQSGGELVAFAGILPHPEEMAEIGHIAVLGEWQGRGIGRWLVGALRRNFGSRGLGAETGEGAVEFYRKCGFAIQSLGMKYPRTERFWCVFEVEGKESSLPRQTVRMAGLGDVALLVSMNQELLRAESSRNPLDIEQLEERLRGWMKRAWQAAILEVNGATAGYGLYRIGSDHFDDEGFYVELRQLFIAAGHRRQGLGRWFVERLRTRFFPRRSRVVLDVLESNAQGRAFWSAMGFEPYARTLEWRGGDSTGS